MTSLLEGARKLVTRGSDIGARLEGLESAVAAARGRLDDELVDDAAAVVTRATGRLRLSADHTVVAIAGATGSGKSSTFNALIGLDLAAVGVRRPTTSWATACVWGTDGADEVLDWLEIPPRHRVVRDSMLDVVRADRQLDGVVLLDLPDHDSTEVSHHLEVDRLVRLADIMVWVLDPQKYADAALHDRYLAPMAPHRDVMVVVLNHLDRVPPAGREQMLGDVRRLLDQDGLEGVPVFGVSAREREGIAELKKEIAGRVAAKKSTRTRIAADVRAAAERLDEATGRAEVSGLPPERVAALEDAFADAAGVPTVVDAVEQSTRVRANRATGWPVVSWLGRLRPDPLKRLHLDLGAAGKQLTGRARTSVPQPTEVQRARVDTEVRALADEVSTGLARPFATAVRRASTARLDDLGDGLDRAVGGTDLGAAQIPAWAGVVRAAQWLLVVAALGGAAWLAALAVMGYLQLPEPATPDWRGLPVPTLLLLGGVGLGVLLALGSRVLVRLTARRRARRADQRLRRAIHDVAQELVVGPVEDELGAYREVRDGLDRALR
ncbi:GTPase [Nocardioides coralli]|uniref:GTPase n=1 Tax=Nocardioides coralli TaxID=2872154 RepID=UPI001CA3FC69|nr:GTPase [Nocardioides coralli]QZY28317.1 50S ribosome-binding GTPase [Nocardioides coralli]